MDEQTMLQILQVVAAAMQGNQLAIQIILQILLEALQGDLLAIQLMQIILQVSQLMQGLQALSAKFGAKLNYIKLLRGICPDGYELSYYKSGGRLCKKCLKKLNGDALEYQDPIDSFKAGRKMKACGGSKFKKK